MSPRKRVSEVSKDSIAFRLREFFRDESSDKIFSKTGVNAGTVRGYMNGRQQPSAEFLAAVAKLGGDVHYILTGNRRPQPDNLIEAAAPDSDSNGKCLEFIAALLAAQRLHGGNAFFEDWCQRNAEELRGMVEHPGLVEKASQIMERKAKGEKGKETG